MTIEMGKVFATIQFACCVLAAIGYFFSKDWRHAIYWAAAAILTGSVTF